MRCFIILLLLHATNFLYAQTFKVGDKVDMYSTDGNYYAASVREVNSDQYKIRFDAYGADKDIWVQGAILIRGGRPGEKIIVVSDKGVFYGVIQQVQNTSYIIKYDGYPETYTLTRKQFNFVNSPSTISPAISPPLQTVQAQKTPVTQQTNGFAIGTKLQALQGSTWYIAVVKDFKNGKYLVKYDGYNEEEWLPIANLRAIPSLAADKLKATTGKTYIRSIRWIATGYTELNWYFLGDNGVIVVDPVHGLSPVNLALEQADNFKNVGYYTIANNQINIKWLNGRSVSLNLTYKNGEIIEMDAGGIMVRQKGLAENYRLSGTYKGSISYGNVGSASTYTFTKDGQITATRTGTANAADASGRASNNKIGTYSIKGNTLFAKYTDGTKETANIGVFTGVPGKLVLNGNWMAIQ